jgi:hypothetical protein
VDVKMVARVGGHALMAGGAWRSLREAHAEGDRLRLLDAVVHALAVVTAIALFVRELQQERSLKGALDVED